MSRSSSTVLTIQCDVKGCEKQQVNVQVGQIVQTEADWGSLTLDGERDFDLCPEHVQAFEDFMYGPDDDHAENNADGMVPFDTVKEECI